MKHVITFAMAVALGAGCMTNSPEDDLGEQVEEVTGHQSFVLADTSDATLDLGGAFGRACFLSGVAGNITTWPFPTAGAGAGAGVHIVNGRWVLYIDTLSPGQRLSAWARCINSTSQTPVVTWTTGQAPAILAPVVPGRYCFLEEVSTSRLGASHGGFQSPGDSVTIVNDGTSWKLQGSVEGRATASASCVTVSQSIGEYFDYAYTTNTVEMAPSDGGATACFLTQLAGAIDDGSDWYQGLYVHHDTATLRYELLAKDYTGGRARCVK